MGKDNKVLINQLINQLINCNFIFAKTVSRQKRLLLLFNILDFRKICSKRLYPSAREHGETLTNN